MKNFKAVRFICLLLLLCFALVQSARAFQNDDNLALPKVEDVQQIETKDNKYHFRYYTTQSLLRMLPHLIAGNIKAKNDPEFQYGTMTLKDGTILKWRSSRESNLVLYNDDAEKIYVIDENYVFNDPVDYFWLKIVSIFTFAFWLVGIAHFYDYREKNPNSRLTRFYEISLVRISLRLFFASLAFYLAYLMFLESLQAINDQVIRGTISSKGGASRPFVYFADTNPGNFRFFVFSASIPSIFALICGTFILIARPRITYWLTKFRESRKIHSNNETTNKGECKQASFERC